MRCEQILMPPHSVWFAHLDFFPCFSSLLRAPLTPARAGKAFLLPNSITQLLLEWVGAGERPPTQHEFASSLGSQLLWLLLPLGGGEEGPSRGLCSSAQLHRGSLWLPGMAAHPQMEDEALGVLAVCCLAAQKGLEAVLRHHSAVIH